MAGILANSASKTMLAGDTATDKAVSGYLVGEQVTLTVTPSGAAYAWSMARPVEGTGRSDLSAGTGASVKFTPDAEGYYTITCLVDSVTSYTIRIATVAIGTVTDVAAARHQALLNSQIPTPSVGLTLFNSSDAGGLAVKGSDGNVTALSAGVTERYATLTALRAAAPVAARYVFLSYRTTAGDNGGGIFRGATGAAAATYVDNGGTIIVPDGGNGSAAWLRVFEGPAFVEWFGGGTAASGATNSTALTAALTAATDVRLGPGTYTFGAAVSIPAGRKIEGAGRAVTILSQGFNGILFPAIADDVTICDLSYVGNGATHAAGGFCTFTGTSGARFLGERLSLTGSGGLQIEYTATTAGSQSVWSNLVIDRYNGVGTGRFAVKILDSLQANAYPRKFIDIESNGADFIDLGGCNNLFITGGYLGRILWSDNSRGVFIYGGRLGGETVNRRVMRGANHSIVGCDLSQNLTDGICCELASGTNATAIQGCTFNSIYPVLDSSGQGSVNMIDHRVMVFVPTITAAGGGFSLGNGDARASFTRSGGNITLNMELTAGTTTNFGTGVLRFSLVGSVSSGIAFTSLGNALVPVSGIAQTQYGTGQVEDVSAVDRRVILPRAVQAQTYLECFVEGGNQQLTGAAPFTLASGDLIRFSITYQL